MKRGTLVELEWHDSERVPLGWASTDRYMEALKDQTKYRTAGYFIGRANGQTMVALNRSDSGQMSDAICIPDQVITKRRRLR